MIYSFDRFTLDVERFALCDADGQTLVIQSRALELLLLLVRNSGKLVTTEDIRREIWGGLYTTRAAISFQIRKVRDLLDDKQAPYRLIETVHGKGVRFIASVEERDRRQLSLVDPAPINLAEPDERLGLTTDWVGKQPTVAVMPFSTQSDADALDGLAGALPTDIIVALSRLRLLRVSARSSSFVFGTKTMDLHEIRSALDVDYCLSGTVTRLGDKYGVFTELADTETQNVVWAEQFEVNREDLHEARQTIVGQLVAQIETKVPRSEALKLRLKQPDSMTAWQAFHVGSFYSYRRGHANMHTARIFFERAVAIDPGFARAWAGLAHTHAFDFIQSNVDDRAAPLRSLIKSSERAYDSDPDDPTANLFMGRAVNMGDLDDTPENWFEKAVELAPSYALAHQQLGSRLAMTGEVERGADHSAASILLSPQGPERFSSFATLAISKFRSGKVAEALEWGRKAGRVPYDDVEVLLTGLSSNHLSGDHQTAERIAGRIRSAFPTMTTDEIFSLHPYDDQLRSVVEPIYKQYGL